LSRRRDSNPIKFYQGRTASQKHRFDEVDRTKPKEIGPLIILAKHKEVSAEGTKHSYDGHLRNSLELLAALKDLNGLKQTCKSFAKHKPKLGQL